MLELTLLHEMDFTQFPSDCGFRDSGFFLGLGGLMVFFGGGVGFQLQSLVLKQVFT